MNNKSLIAGRSVSRDGRIACGRLNAFFAISVNSPPQSMVNFSCCVRIAPDVTREVTAQPTHSVRMESGIHAGV